VTQHSTSEIPLPYTVGVEEIPESHVGGLHSIAINPARPRFATNGRSSNDIVIFSSESMEPTALLQGHSDWVFSQGWLDGEHLISASRDTTVRLWRPRQSRGQEVRPRESESGQEVAVTGESRSSACVAVATCHTDKVRATAIDRDRGQFTTLGDEGNLISWDSGSFTPESRVKMDGMKGFVCSTIDEESGICIVGSSEHVSMVDFRTARGISHIIPSLDEGCGVRTVGIRHQVITVGGGLGRMSFYDMRASKYMDILPGKSQHWKKEAGHGQSFFTVGDGFLKRDNIFEEFFQQHVMQHAVYTHAYDPSGTKLFVGGGPRYFGLTGCYAAVL